MKEIHADLSPVINSFPDREETLIKLFRESEQFRNICQDYRKCKEAYDYWNRPGIKDPLERKEEYAALLQELKSEIIENLDEHMEVRRKA